MEINRVGVWAPGLRFGDPGEAKAAAAELEELGYGPLWIPGAANPGTLDDADALLGATTRVTIATGIVNIWVEDASAVAAGHHRLNTDHDGRFLLGLGISHAPLIGDRYKRPLAAMQAYLDELDAADPPVPADERVLAAIGPKMLNVARERARGSHTYLMPPEHTAAAREALGEGALLAPEQTVVLESDPARAREIARGFLKIYLGLPNYMDHLRRIFALTDADFADGGSDRLVDATVAWGDEEAIRTRVQAHLDAGADHVCIQVITGDRRVALPRDEWRRLAGVLS
jgi:probable F420-dependent oxidoreductase